MPSTAVLVSATALNLPAFSAGLGYGYFQRGDVPGVPISEFLFTAQTRR
ncbi:MAG: hypothetical protein JWM63_3320 [Gammaproteobacteria bacterium]|nr:hypothetical protein [Gammaproteobacteria bacterium]